MCPQTWTKVYWKKPSFLNQIKGPRVQTLTKLLDNRLWSWPNMQTFLWKYSKIFPSHMFMSYFVPFRSKSWPKVENDQKWSWFELCSKWLQIGPNSDIKSYFSHFIEKFDQKWKMVKNEVRSNFAPKNKSDIVIFCPISTKQLTKSGKWLKVKLVRTLLQMGPNSQIKSYFVPFQTKSWPKVENG